MSTVGCSILATIALSRCKSRNVKEESLCFIN